MPEEIATRILRLPGYEVYASEVDEATHTLILAIRQTAAEPLPCVRRVRDLGAGDPPLDGATAARSAVGDLDGVAEGRRASRPLSPLRGADRTAAFRRGSYTARLEARVAQDCEAAPVSRVAGQRGVPPETGRRIDKRALRRWAAARPRTPLHCLGVDEIYLGKRDAFLTVVSDLETGEPLWVGRERKQETLDRFFTEALPPARRRAVRAVCVDMWEPFRLSLQEHLPHAKIVYDKFHVLRHASEALDETRRAESFRQGAEARGLIRGKRWLLLRRWANLDWEQRETPRELFALNRRLAKAYLLNEELGQLWRYTYEGAALRCLTNWLRALRWQRLPAFQKLGALLMRHLTGILNYCHEKVPFGKVEAINGNIRAMLRRGRGYRDHEYLLLKVRKATATRRLRQTA
jgi:transposase